MPYARAPRNRMSEKKTPDVPGLLVGENEECA